MTSVENIKFVLLETLTKTNTLNKYLLDIKKSLDGIEKYLYAWKCPNCDAPNKKTNEFCAVCGHKLKK